MWEDFVKVPFAGIIVLRPFGVLTHFTSRRGTMSGLVNWRGCAVFTLAAAINFVAHRETQAAVLITALNSPATENFDAYAGSAATVPANMVWTTTGSTINYGGIYDSSGAYANANASLALIYSTNSTTDRAFGARRPSDAVTYDLAWSFVNNTGANISQFVVTWDVEQYGQGNRATQMNFNYNPNATTPTSTGITGTTLTLATVGSDPGINFPNGPVVTNRSVTIDLATPLLDQQPIDFRWTMTSGAGMNTNARIGWDNLSVTATLVPEPATALLGGGLVWALAGLGRRTRAGRA